MPKILLTGATGFLGSYLLKSFIRDNHEIIILKRSESNTNKIESLKGNYVFYDIEKENIDDIFRIEKPEIIIHTACSYGKNNESITNLVKTNLIFSLEIFEASIRHETKLFVNVDSLLPKKVSNYSFSKSQFSDWLRINTYDINIVNIKIEQMYGPDTNKNKFFGWLFNNIISNSTEKIDLTSGVQKRDFIYIDDVVDAFNLIIKNRNQIKGFKDLDLGTGNFVKVKDFVKAIALEVEEIYKIKVFNRLNFGAVPYRDCEIMKPILDNSIIRSLGWNPRYTYKEGIKETLKNLT